MTGIPPKNASISTPVQAMMRGALVILPLSIAVILAVTTRNVLLTTLLSMALFFVIR